MALTHQLAERLTSHGPLLRNFARNYVVQTIGEWRGKPLIFEGWQDRFFTEALSVDPATGLRIYHEVLLGIPRKNGKSMGASAAGLYMATFDGWEDRTEDAWDDERGLYYPVFHGEGAPQVYVAAGARDQARVIFGQMKATVDLSPRLADVARPMQYEILIPDNGGVIRVISSDAKLQHGSNPSSNLIDELWAHDSDELYTALTSGTAARRQPFTLTLTTSGYDEDSALGQIYTRATKLLDHEQPEPGLHIYRDRANGFLMYWYGAPPDADPEDPTWWRHANPASWVTVDYLRREKNKITMRLADFMRWHLNMWTAAEQPWLPPGTWPALQTKVRDRDGNPLVTFDQALPVTGGVDMGQTYDSTGICEAQRRTDPDGVERVYLRATPWVNPYPVNHPLRGMWQVNQEEVRAHLRATAARYPRAAAMAEVQLGRTTRTITKVMPGPAVAYDPWHFSESAQQLSQAGVNMVEFPQNASRMVPASELFYQLAKEGRLVHDGNPVLAQHVANAVAQLTPRGWRIAKGKAATKPIDLAVAAVMAVWQAMQPVPDDSPPKRRRAHGF